MLRFPNGLRERIKAAAAGNKRSMNAEIVQRLEESFAMEEGAQWQPAATRLDLPPGVSVDDYAQALEAAVRQATSLTLHRLGITQTLLSGSSED